MDARAWTGGPDDDPYRSPGRGGPLEKQCDNCLRWPRTPVSYAQIWFFCDADCRDAWQGQTVRKHA